VTGDGRTLVGSGLVPSAEELRIVDPETRRPCAPNQIGEIWISGDHVGQGYCQRPELTADTFQARCAGESEPGYLRTGDLGVVIEGELYVVGRLKDMIIIRGSNYYPQDIEHTVESAHSALQPAACAAFAVAGAGGDTLVVVQEVRREGAPAADAAEVAASTREAIVREHQVSVADVVLILPGQLQKTSSGKIMRAAARRRYLDSGYQVWAPVGHALGSSCR
jgi:acyl-CoA synthetase (AMP-forming)/AMP-acid ligase II